MSGSVSTRCSGVPVAAGSTEKGQADQSPASVTTTCTYTTHGRHDFECMVTSTAEKTTKCKDGAMCLLCNLRANFSN